MLLRRALPAARQSLAHPFPIYEMGSSRFLSVLSVQSVVNFILAQGSRLLFLTEFLESGIGAQRVPDRIESKKGWRNGRSTGTRGIGRV